MNILLLNHSWLAEELRERGHRVTTAGIYQPHLDISFSTSTVTLEELKDALPFKVEKLVYYDDSGVPWLLGLERWTIPKIFYSVDTHHHHQWHTFFADLFEHVLVAQRKYIELFQDHEQTRSWFPPWAPITVQADGDRDIAVSFRGNLDPKLHPARAAFFERLSLLLPGDYGSGEYVPVYSRSKVVVNEAVSDDLNFRVFEAMMCGSLLITPQGSTGLAELFENGSDLLTYRDGDAEDAARQAHWALENESDRRRIAASGSRKVRELHSKDARAKTLELLLMRLTAQRNSPRLFFNAAQSYLFSFLVSKAGGFGVHLPLLRAAENALVASTALKEQVETDDETQLRSLLRNLQEQH